MNADGRKYFPGQPAQLARMGMGREISQINFLLPGLTVTVTFRGSLTSQSSIIP